MQTNDNDFLRMINLSKRGTESRFLTMMPFVCRGHCRLCHCLHKYRSIQRTVAFHLNLTLWNLKFLILHVHKVTQDVPYVADRALLFEP
jgi:hypothetical protein